MELLMKRVVCVTLAELCVSLLCGPAGVLPHLDFLILITTTMFIIILSMMPVAGLGGRQFAIRLCGVVTVIVAMMAGTCIPMLFTGHPYWGLELLKYALFSVVLSVAGVVLLTRGKTRDSGAVE
jgi:hypothetical protein